MNRIYLSGPMSGLPDWNRPAFMEAAGRLRNLGFEVVNPAEVSIRGGSWADFMRHDIRLMMDVDGVVTLPGWRQSKGASLEVYIAEHLHMPVYELEHFMANVAEVRSAGQPKVEQLSLDLTVEEPVRI
ncbi:DUF4406 domain-containing protein [Alicyclobacillus acidiphilus]|uniref:DUF4406 domain-containing protein n=1 Tax=Alicyclobacillus acidiphilus TaxID=182455 RepID=UPI000831A0F3|nr:DUF4406 domain-containing protein [Alicyclobacillus acidiphilus]